MHPSADIYYDVTSALSLGQRDQQEDAVVADFPIGLGMGFAVLADGMGGHAAGDVASKIVVTEVFSELKMQAGDPTALENQIVTILRDAALSANECVRMHAQTNPETEGMGATLVAPVLFGNRLYWISIGDSPLYLFRQGVLTRLNEDHSMTSQIDYMVDSGMVEEDWARNHPDRNCLTSVLIGEEIARIDCPVKPVEIVEGDIVVVASDGLEFLTEEEIVELIQSNLGRSSAEIGASLMKSLSDLGDPDQDNISLCVIQVSTSLRNASQPVPQAAKVGKVTPRRIQNNSGGVTVMASRSKSKKVVTYRLSMEKSA